MSEALITLENVSNEHLRSILDEALLECFVEDDVLVARDGYKCVIFIGSDRGLLTLRTMWRFKEGTPRSERLEAANAMNDRLPVVKASVTEKGSLVFEHDLLLDGGIPPRAFATTVRRFLFLMRDAIAEFDALIA